MPNEGAARPKHKKPKRSTGAQSKSKHGYDVQSLNQAVTTLVRVFVALKSEPGTDVSQDIDSLEVKKFEDLPLSNFTRDGLKTCHYINTTGIQSKAIPLALKGRDILGAAQTGTAKPVPISILKD